MEGVFAGARLARLLTVYESDGRNFDRMKSLTASLRTFFCAFLVCGAMLPGCGAPGRGADGIADSKVSDAQSDIGSTTGPIADPDIGSTTGPIFEPEIGSTTGPTR